MNKDWISTFRWGARCSQGKAPYSKGDAHSLFQKRPYMSKGMLSTCGWVPGIRSLSTLSLFLLLTYLLWFQRAIEKGKQEVADMDRYMGPSRPPSPQARIHNQRGGWVAGPRSLSPISLYQSLPLWLGGWRAGYWSLSPIPCLCSVLLVV